MVFRITSVVVETRSAGGARSIGIVWCDGVEATGGFDRIAEAIESVCGVYTIDLGSGGDAV